MGSLQTPFFVYYSHMKNTHLEHPEDSALISRESVQKTIKYLRNAKGNCTVKYDGAPAIVFGINPENGKFFVGTKSVFNKVKVKINYTHSDIEKNHGNNEKVAAILHTCLAEFPKDIKGIYQCDFIGYGGEVCFTPNTITYDFNAIQGISNSSVIAVCHTSYTGKTIKELEASFVDYTHGDIFDSNSSVYFVDCNAQFTSRRRRINYILGLASVVSNFVKYPETKKEIASHKIAVNDCIRKGLDVSEVLSGNMLLLFNLLTQAKLLLMEGITVIGDDVRATIDLGVDYINSGHEGYVHSNDYGAYKLVNREVFSHYNFTLPKGW
jgi:hypothetical protein